MAPMKELRWVVMTSVLLCSGLAAQQPATQVATPADSQGPKADSNGMTVYVVGGDVSAPKLISSTAELMPPEECRDKIQGRVALEFVLDKAGIPRDIGYRGSDRVDLFDTAEKILRSERFIPAMRNGEGVPVSFLGILTLSACHARKAAARDEKAPGFQLIGKGTVFQLIEKPSQALSPLPITDEDAQYALGYTDIKEPIEGGYKLESVGGGVNPPVPLNSVQAEFSPEAKEHHISGVVLVHLAVDPQGMPRDIRVIRPCGFGLDDEAIKAVRSYRFKPAVRGHEPVPVFIVVEVNFRFR